MEIQESQDIKTSLKRVQHARFAQDSSIFFEAEAATDTPLLPIDDSVKRTLHQVAMGRGYGKYHSHSEY
jgi:hypothetical protein